jgi:chromosomal replication initiation ATPase DnaA
MEQEKKEFNITDYIASVCNRFGITDEQLKSKSRLSVLVTARIIIAKRLRKEGLSLPSIGMILGNRDHTSICYYLDKKTKNRAK